METELFQRGRRCSGAKWEVFVQESRLKLLPRLLASYEPFETEQADSAVVALNAVMKRKGFDVSPRL